MLAFGASPVNDKDGGGRGRGRRFKLEKSAERTEVPVCSESAYRQIERQYGVSVPHIYNGQA